MLTFEQFLKEDHERDFKGWMSPNGVPHVFHHGEHSDNHHPEIADSVAKSMKGSALNPSVRFFKSLAVGMGHGYARFGRHYGQHYLHFDQKSPGGSKAALHALKFMGVGPGTKLDVTTSPWRHKPWSRAESNKYEKTFESPSQAAQHIRKYMKET